MDDACEDAGKGSKREKERTPEIADSGRDGERTGDGDYAGRRMRMRRKWVGRWTKG